MKIEKELFTQEAQVLLKENGLIQQAYQEVVNSICSPVWPTNAKIFTINSSGKNGNGVVPIKELCYVMLEEKYNWFREKPLNVLKHEKKKGGPIDVYKVFEESTKYVENGEEGELVNYKEFTADGNIKRIGLEFETGNISSAHRSMNKLLLGLKHEEIDLAIILMPVFELAYYLTDRVTNFEELEPYFELTEGRPFIFIGFNADDFDPSVPTIPKGKDGMSKRSIKKWKDNIEENKN